jgi:DNA-binding transcriptional LysR family regulator
LIDTGQESMFELGQLRCFVIVTEELHFSRAAARLHMTQPPLSRQIRLLEHQLGAQLLERTSRRVRLTHAGRSFLPQARTILRLAESASLTAQRVSRGDAGSLSIGFTASSSYRLLPRLIALCRERLPNVDLTLKEMVTLEQIDALASGELDLALLRPYAANADFKSFRVAREPLVAALSENHPRAQGPLPTLMDFDRAPFIMYSPVEARYFHDLVAGTFFRAGVNPDYIQYLSQIHSILALVKVGLGAALVPEAATTLQFKGVVFRRVQKIRPPRAVDLYMAWNSENDNPALKRLLDYSMERLRVS